VRRNKIENIAFCRARLRLSSISPRHFRPFSSLLVNPEIKRGEIALILLAPVILPLLLVPSFSRASAAKVRSRERELRGQSLSSFAVCGDRLSFSLSLSVFFFVSLLIGVDRIKYSVPVDRLIIARGAGETRSCSISFWFVKVESFMHAFMSIEVTLLSLSIARARFGGLLIKNALNYHRRRRRRRRRRMLIIPRQPSRKTIERRSFDCDYSQSRYFQCTFIKRDESAPVLYISRTGDHFC